MSLRLIAQGTVNAAWDGMPQVLGQGGSVMMPQTPNGSLIVGYFNQAKRNNAGKLLVTSGGSQPINVPVPALLQMLSILVNNWQASNLTLTNVSVNATTPIFVEAFGPGVPGVKPLPLQLNVMMQLGMRQAAQGTSPPNWMQLQFTASSANLEIVAVVGGPQIVQGNNAYVIALNSPFGDTGPNTGYPAPPGYYATAGGNSYSFPFNWGAASVYVVNLSPQGAVPVSVILQSL